MMATPERCRVAVIGAGYTAREHIRAFVDVPGVAVVGIHSRTRARAKALATEFGIPAVCDSVSELYEKTRADLVVVTVVELSMNAVSRACFEFPWTALLEKPAGYNVPDAEAIYACAKAKNRKALVALNRRFYSSTRAMQNDLAQLDGPRFIKVQDQEDQAAALDFGQPQPVVDNWMYANSIHVVDYLRLLGRGKIVRVEPIVPWTPTRPGVVVSHIEFESGDIGLYEGIWNGPGPWAVNATTPAKRWELRPLEQAAFQNRGERKLQAVEIHTWDQTFKPGFRLQAAMAVAAALGRPSESPTLEDALETMRLIQSIFKW
jgi:predicted dehydrogenase